LLPTETVEVRHSAAPSAAGGSAGAGCAAGSSRPGARSPTADDCDAAALASADRVAAAAASSICSATPDAAPAAATTPCSDEGCSASAGCAVGCLTPPSLECGGAGAIVEEEAPATQQEVAAEGVLEGSQGLQPSAKGATKEGLGSGENRAPRPPTCFRIGVPLDNYTY
jgi:hypothetical protein